MTDSKLDTFIFTCAPADFSETSEDASVIVRTQWVGPEPQLAPPCKLRFDKREWAVSLKRLAPEAVEVVFERHPSAAPKPRRAPRERKKK